MHSVITLFGMAEVGETSVGKVLFLKLSKRFLDSFVQKVRVIK
tara:strand:+ start:539 stop:667 length:129 start_codon:yes stop_codon:yes gene_type:complete